MIQRKSKKQTIQFFAFLFVFFFMIGCSPQGEDSNTAEEMTELEGPYSVIRVVDGDTFVIRADGEEEKVRLIGLDTPESVHADPDRNSPYGEVASEYTRSMVDGEEVYLEFDVSPRDKYGRLLAYVYVDGKMLNEMILKEGHGRAGTYPPNVKYTDRFYELQREAREENRGGWAVDAFEDK